MDKSINRPVISKCLKEMSSAIRMLKETAKVQDDVPEAYEMWLPIVEKQVVAIRKVLNDFRKEK